MDRSAITVDLSQSPVGQQIALPACPSFIQVLRGAKAVLAAHPMLVDLCARCGQAGAMDYLEYFVHSLDSLKKIPHLLLFGAPDHKGELQADDLQAAVLLYEYRVLGRPSTMFATDDGNADRTVIAPLEQRAEVSALAARCLLQKGATVVLISFQQHYARIHTPAILNTGDPARWLWAMQGREFGRQFPLHQTFEQTLLALGQNTRRNMKRYRQRAERDLGATFVPNVVLSQLEFREINKLSRDPVSQEQVDWRYGAMLKSPGMFVSGVRSTSGEWLSLIGGYRHHGRTVLTFQVNRDGFAAYALSTVMRSFLVEYEVALGTKSLLFEGGTPHSMRHSFIPEQAVDLIALRHSTPGKVFRRTAKYLLPEKNFLGQLLSDKKLEWRPW